MAEAGGNRAGCPTGGLVRPCYFSLGSHWMASMMTWPLVSWLVMTTEAGLSGVKEKVPRDLVMPSMGGVSR